MAVMHQTDGCGLLKKFFHVATFFLFSQTADKQTCLWHRMLRISAFLFFFVNSNAATHEDVDQAHPSLQEGRKGHHLCCIERPTTTEHDSISDVVGALSWGVVMDRGVRVGSAQNSGDGMHSQ